MLAHDLIKQQNRIQSDNVHINCPNDCQVFPSTICSDSLLAQQNTSLKLIIFIDLFSVITYLLDDVLLKEGGNKKLITLLVWNGIKT